MPTLPTGETLAISAPDQIAAAADNLFACGLITRKQARVISLLANQPDPVTVERVGPCAIHVSAGTRRMRVMTTGAVRYP